MKVAIAGDSAGDGLARQVADHLAAKSGFTVFELSKPADGAAEFYADLSDRVCTELLNGTYDRAILVCGTGIGVCIAANKVPGIRAALTHDTYSAEKASTSNNAQVITMGARVIGAEVAKSIADVFLANSFDTEGRSKNNVAAIDKVDQKYHS
ncbi:MAG: RpiB/LacA/LacB family sugar-phosphate isomerase [Gammaproteobacteria bacterium]|nr:RpiB/LacA/LacB family sugar-phosphate isomerase [Gammaproteobacteria bacterium]